MLVLGNLFIAVGKILNMALWLYMWVIIIRALISWVSPDPYNPIVQFLVRSTEPVLEPIRRHIPIPGIDISPIIAVILIYFLNEFLVRSLIDFGLKLR